MTRVVFPTIISATSVNGTVASNQTVSAYTLLPVLMSHPHQIHKLQLSSIHLAALQLLLPLFGKRMAFLEELEIAIKGSMGLDTIVLSGPMLVLPAALYPTLKVLRLDGVAARMDTPFLPTLRHIVLKNYPGLERSLFLTDFLAALAGCPHLETLEIRHFFNVLSCTEAKHPKRPVMLLSLRELTVAESPNPTQMLLQLLGTLPTADIRVDIDVKGHYDDDFGRTFGRVIPPNRNSIPILKAITHVEVNLVRGSTYQLIGATPRGNRLVLEIDMSVEFALGFTGGALLYESAVRNLGDVFRGSPVTHAVFSGDFARVTAGSWRAALGALPGLKKLKITDSGTHAAGMPALCEALSDPVKDLDDADSEAKHICQHLEVLCVCGTAYGVSHLEDVVNCLNRRNEASCAKLQALWFQLKAEPVHDDGEQLIKVKDMLADLVQHSRIQVLT
ncbi:hypothetical protein C2E23DRAFT_858199 [Lenzites betulinus]|nr:hypothetical protein C2E23DRAFT_858199 [Lenzites betulinus]